MSRFDTPRFGKSFEPDDWMEVIGPNGPERRRYMLVRSDRGVDPLFVKEPDHDSETERVERTIDGKVYIIQTKS